MKPAPLLCPISMMSPGCIPSSDQCLSMRLTDGYSVVGRLDRVLCAIAQQIPDEIVLIIVGVRPRLAVSSGLGRAVVGTFAPVERQARCS